MGMRIEPEISGVQVVLVGDFNPAIFTPAWFALYRLLPESVASSAKLEVAHPQATKFTADWLHLEVTVERFVVHTLQAPHVRVRDLVVRVFREHLYHTPLKALGINRNVHFRVRNLTERDRIGRTLAPVEPWGTWGHDLGLDGTRGGMTSLRMSQLEPNGRPSGDKINVTVEPSARIGEGRTGVFVNVNDHHVIDETGPRAGTGLMNLLEKNFDESLKRSDDIIDHIMSLAQE
jgi:hypothetical protein